MKMLLTMIVYVPLTSYDEKVILKGSGGALFLKLGTQPFDT